jgi:hypothetical protein
MAAILDHELVVCLAGYAWQNQPPGYTTAKGDTSHRELGKWFFQCILQRRTRLSVTISSKDTIVRL